MLSFILILQIGQLYNKSTYKMSEEWIMNSKTVIILERTGTIATVFHKRRIKTKDYSNTIVRSYLLANF
jgi:hypothetical protein